MAIAASRPGHRFFALAVVAGPILLLLSDVAYVVAGDGINDGVLGGTIGVWSCFVLAWAFIGLSNTLRREAPRGALALLILAIPAFVGGGVAFNVEALHRDHFGTSILEAALVAGDADALIGVFSFLPWGWMGPASFVLLGVLVWRSPALPTWAGALGVLGGVLFVVARPATIDALAIACDVVLVAAMAPLGLAMLSGRRDDRPDLPAEAGAAR